MTMTMLSERLQAIADRVSKGARLADIGTDHALLPVSMVERGWIERAIAGEVRRGPLLAAMNRVEQAGLAAQISVRLGNGLDVIEPGEVDTIVIAGMGGSLITQILANGKDKLSGVRKLILQPNVGEDLVRRWLVEGNWFLSNETIIQEAGQIYEILEAESDAATDGKAAELNAQLYRIDNLLTPASGIPLQESLLYRMGPYLLRQPTSLLTLKWQGELNKMLHIYAQLNQARQPEALAKQNQLAAEIKCLEEILDCLPKDKP